RGEHLRLHLQAVIADGALLTRQRGIVDDRRLLAAPAQDVAGGPGPAGGADPAGGTTPLEPGIGVRTPPGRVDPGEGPAPLRPKSPAGRAASARRRRDSGLRGHPWRCSLRLTTSSRGTAARRAGGGRAHRPLFGAIVSARGAFASRAERTTRLCGKMLAR